MSNTQIQDPQTVLQPSKFSTAVGGDIVPNRSVRSPITAIASQAFTIVKSVVCRVPARLWLVGGGVSVVGFFYLGQMSPKQETVTKTDPAQIEQAFDEAALLKIQQQVIAAKEINLSAFMRSEKQLQDIAVASGYQGLAAFFVTSPGHYCYRGSVLNCLDSFVGNRITALKGHAEALAKPGGDGTALMANDPSSAVDPILWAASETQRVEGLRLARVLATPLEARTDWEREWIERVYPVLKSKTPAEQLRPRPGDLAVLLTDLQGEYAKLNASSSEAQLRLASCFSLTPEEQAARGGCQ